MDKKRIELIATAIMVFILIIAWMNSMKAIRKRSSPAPVVAAAGSVTAEPKAQMPSGAKPAVNKTEPQDEISQWGRDPFSGKIYVTASRAQGLGDLKVEGIIWDKNNPMAMVNGHVLKKGDNFKGNVVVDIKENSVILNDGNRDLELKIGK